MLSKEMRLELAIPFFFNKTILKGMQSLLAGCGSCLCLSAKENSSKTIIKSIDASKYSSDTVAQTYFSVIYNSSKIIKAK